MSLYLTDQTTTDTVEEAAKNPNILAFKLYPAGATTHSDAGVTDLEKLHPIFDRMQALEVPLQIHGRILSGLCSIKLTASRVEICADFYGLAANSAEITLESTPWVVPDHYQVGDNRLIPLFADETISHGGGRRFHPDRCVRRRPFQ